MQIIVDKLIYLWYNSSSKQYIARGRSSAGRALEWHSRGQRFDPVRLHQTGIGRTPISSAAASPQSVRSDPQQKSAVLEVIPRRRFFTIIYYNIDSCISVNLRLEHENGII